MNFITRHLASIALGYLLDLLIGDPYWFPHPVRLMGWFINKSQKWIRKVCKTKKSLKIGGVILLLSTTLLTMGALLLIMTGLKALSPVIAFIGQVLFCWMILSTKSLAYEANMVKKALEAGLEEGRNRVAYIVGRDTATLSEQEVIKATIETVAENTTDGIVSPLFYLCIGGIYAGMVFKAVSTLDSMVGYTSKKYRQMGWASAKTDDFLNFVPARITGYLMVLSAWLLQLDFRNSYKIMKRDHANHKSPNCAWSESSVAGAMGIQLGGTHFYFGEEVYKPTIGDHTRLATKMDIRTTNSIMYITSLLSLFFFALITFSVIMLFVLIT